ncbi:MAG: SMP-30/gluconolactonase/LRE family protein [Nannocystaceae bacterium]|nr:SMP-30/gluconolactonase/LRE family protein [Myxococcales bacterium]
MRRLPLTLGVVLGLVLACGDDDDGTTDASTTTGTGTTAGSETTAAPTTADPTTATTDEPTTDEPTTAPTESTDGTETTDSETTDSETTDTDATDTDTAPDQDPLADMEPVEERAAGFMFTEGPVWLPDEGVVLFTDIPADTIYRFLPEGDGVAVQRPPSDPARNTNGLALDPDGAVISCEHATAQVTRIVGGDQTEVLADNFEGGTFNSPNDLISHPNGIIYFTDPTYGGMGSLGFQGVFARAPDGVVTLVAGDMTAPNGVILSPALDTLYVSDSMLGLVSAFPVDPDGVTGPGQLFVETGGGGDGLTVDANGNLYVATGAGVLVLRPDGTSWGTIAFPQEPSNCTFGDDDLRTLYVTARTGFYSVRLAVPGLPP